MWGRADRAADAEEAGFGEVAVREVEGDVLNVYYVARKELREPSGGGARRAPPPYR